MKRGCFDISSFQLGSSDNQSILRLMSTSTLLQSLLACKARADAELFAELAQLDPAAWQAQRHTALRILNHLFVVDRIFAAHLSGRAHGYTATNTPETPGLDELAAGLAESDRWYVDYVASLAPESLSERIAFTFTDGRRGCMSREEMLLHVATHAGYHRGAVGRVVTELSTAPPRDTLTVFLHETEPSRRERA